MKKVLSIVLAALMLTAIAVPAFAEGTTPATVHFADIGKKVDILDKKTVYSYSPNKGTKIDVKNFGNTTFSPEGSNGCLTDGIICHNLGTKADGTVLTATGDSVAKSYLNFAWYKNSDKIDGKTLRTDYFKSDFVYPEDKKYTLPGVTTKYLYYLEAPDLGGVKADSFALYMSSEDRATQPNESITSNAWMDAEFDILVSTDGGTTYKVAYSSIPYKTTLEGETTVITSFCGNEKTDKCDGSTKVVSQRREGTFTGYDANAKTTDFNGYDYIYRLIEGKFDKEYTGVTNVVYASKTPRISTSDYAARFTEFDVYYTPSNPTTGDSNLIVAMIAAGVVALGSSVVVIRKRREEI